MDEMLSVVGRIELPPTTIDGWRTQVLDVSTYEPAADFGWSACVREAERDGVLDDPLPTTVDGLIRFLAGTDGWRAELGADHVELRADAMQTADSDPWFIRGAIAIALLAHAVETSGAQGYLYLLEAGPTEEELPTSLRLWGRAGRLHRDERGDEPARVEFADAVRARLLASERPWTFAEDEP